MKRKLLQTLSMMLVFCVIAYGALSQAPVFNTVTPSGATVEKNEKFELSIDLTATFTNGYDYDDIAVKCSFKSPGGTTQVVDGFYMQDYTLNATNGSIATNGAANFRVRFAPTETGTWEYTLSCTTAGGTTTRAVQTFSCTAPVSPGFIRKNATRYLAFDNGAQYIPIGENMCWYNTNAVIDYTNWLSKLSANKGNFIRVWMPAWAFGIEWKTGNGFNGLKQYKQSSAYYLDWLVDQCRQKNVYMMLCLNHHGQVSSTTDANWSDNPYNAANGGPCTNTWDFFTNTTAKTLIKNRLRYIMARYGFSRNIMCWELFNEVEWTDQFNNHKADVTSWHDEMAQYIKTNDVYKHLVTTSYAQDGNDPNTWNLASMDFTQTHYYVNTPNIETVLGAGIVDYNARFNKPTMNGEFGLGPAGAQLSTMDPAGVHIHNSLWGTAFSGGMGAGMSWWWDTYIEPRNLYSNFKPLSELLATLPLKDEAYKKGSASVTGGGTSDISISPGAGFGAAVASTFSVESGGIAPGQTQLGSYLFGSIFNTQYHFPPSFNVNYPVAGQFKVVTGSTTGTLPKISISLDGTEKLNVNAAVSSTYTIDVPAGTHVIKVDNPGTDWIFISSYVFTNIGSPLNTYILKNSDTSKFAGWVHNKQYNFKYLSDNGNTPPPAITGASATIKGVQSGSYAIQFYNCTTGASTGSTTASTTSNDLTVVLPSVAWDLAMVATRTGGPVTAVVDLPSAKQLKVFPNPLIRTNLIVEYDLTRRSAVSIGLYDILGSELKKVYSGTQQAGPQKHSFSIADLHVQSDGIYLVKVQIGNDSHLEKVYIAK